MLNIFGIIRQNNEMRGRKMKLRPKIKERRMEKHMNQKQFAEKMCVSQNTLSKWETGKVYPSLKYLYRMEKILECTLLDLYAE